MGDGGLVDQENPSYGDPNPHAELTATLIPPLSFCIKSDIQPSPLFSLGEIFLVPFFSTPCSLLMSGIQFEFTKAQNRWPYSWNSIP